MQAGPAGIGLLLLPGLGDLEDIDVLQRRAAKRGGAQLRLILLRRVGGDPFPRRGAERGLLRGVVEIHRQASALVGWAKAQRAVPTDSKPVARMVGTLRFAHPTDRHSMTHAAFLLRMRSIN